MYLTEKGERERGLLNPPQPHWGAARGRRMRRSREGFIMFGTGAGGEILGKTKEGKICYRGSEVGEMNGFGVVGINGDVMGS